MSKYIYADRLKNGIMQYADKYGGISCSVTAFNILLERFAADVQEVRHGHWYVYGNLNYCSVCHEKNDTRTPYCSWCGTKMDEVEE